MKQATAGALALTVAIGASLLVRCGSDDTASSDDCEPSTSAHRAGPAI